MNQFQKQQSEKIRSCYESENLEKGGEGSRGGKIVGYTKSGKPIYEGRGTAKKYESFTKQDHHDAVDHHSNIYHTTNHPGERAQAYSNLKSHQELADKKTK